MTKGGVNCPPCILNGVFSIYFFSAFFFICAEEAHALVNVGRPPPAPAQTASTFSGFASRLEETEGRCRSLSPFGLVSRLVPSRARVFFQGFSYFYLSFSKST